MSSCGDGGACGSGGGGGGGCCGEGDNSLPDGLSTVLRYLRGGLTTDASKVVDEVKSGELTLLAFIEQLGPGLDGGSSEPTRARAMVLLNTVLETAGQEHSFDEVGFLVKFLGDRLQDHVTVVPVLGSLRALINGPAEFVGHEVSAVQGIFANLHVQSSSQEVRQQAFSVMLEITRNHSASLKKHFGTDYAANVVKQVDGEKDPRCLMAAFTLVEQLIISGFPIDGLVEDLFDITSCYFPITFTPPPNDKFGITRAHLVDSLNRCLASTPKFAPMCLELLFEKLSGMDDEAKNQSYGTLMFCAEAYGTAPLVPYLSHIYMTVRSELVQSFDEKLKLSALTCLTSITKTVSKGVTVGSKQDTLKTFVEPLLSDSVRSLGDFDAGLVTMHSRLLAASARASDSASMLILKSFGQAVLEKAKEDISDQRRLTFLQALGDIVNAATHASPYGEENAAATIKAGLTDLLMDSFTRNEAIQSAALSSLANFIRTGAFSAEEIMPFCTTTTDIILSDATVKCKASAQAACIAMMQCYPGVGLEKAIPTLVGALGNGVAGDDTGAIERFVVQTLGTLAIDAEALTSIVQALFKRLKHWGESMASTLHATEKAECIAKTIHGLTSSMRIAPKALLQTFVLPCFKLYFGSESVCTDVGSGILLRPVVITAITGTIRKSCQIMDGAPEREMLDLVLKIFTRGELDSLALPSTHRAVVSGTAPSDEHLIQLMSAAICQLSREMVDTDEVLLLSETFLAFAVKAEQPNSVTAAALAAACILNKLESGDTLTAKLEQAMSFLDKESAGANNRKAEAIQTCVAWLTKGMVMRAHPMATSLAFRMLTTLANTDVGTLAADGYRIVTFDHEVGLNAESFAISTFMYKQRFFSGCLPNLVQGFHAADPAVKANYVLALSHVLSAVPKQVLLSEVDAVWPLLVESLAQPEEGLSSSTLSLMRTLIEEAKDMMAGHAKSLIDALIPLCSYRMMRVRIDALECLLSIASLPTQKVFPYAQRLIMDLMPVLDDRKRLVRQKAVACRSAWIGIGGTS